jgi:four helix bundle protein
LLRWNEGFHELKIWQRSHRLTLDVYRVTQPFPKDEIYGLTSQMRRASASIPANIAEGCGRQGDLELARFFQMAMGSACELEYHLLLAFDLNLLKESEYKPISIEVTEIQKMLASFIMKLRARS